MIFVTGGSGFVGNRVIRELRARGEPVLGLARSDEAAEAITRAGAQPVQGDLGDPEALRDGMRDADVVVHAAARTGDWGRPAEFERVNVEGTNNVLWAMRHAGVGRIVYVSPATVVSRGRPLVLADETVEPPAKPLGWYHRSKLDAERAVLASAVDGFEPVVVRPTLVWGPGDRTWLPRLREAVGTGRFRWIGGGRHPVSTTHVANAAHGIVLAAGRGRPGEVYLVTDGPPTEFREFVTRYLATVGVKAPERGMTTRGGRVLSRVEESVWGLLGAKKAPAFPRATFATIGAECTFSDRKARDEIGYEPVVDPERAMTELAESRARARSGSKGRSARPLH